VLRFLLWRVLGLAAIAATLAIAAWFVHGGPGELLRAQHGASAGLDPGALWRSDRRWAAAGWRWSPLLGVSALATAATLGGCFLATLMLVRARARRRRRYVRLLIDPYRGDHAAIEALPGVFAGLHKRLLRRWWRRLLAGQPSLALEVRHDSDLPGVPASAWLAVTCPAGQERMIEVSLQAAYPNCRLRALEAQPPAPPSLLRLKKRKEFIERAKALDRLARRRAEPTVNQLLTVMAASGGPCLVQLSLTPAPLLFERFAAHVYRRREARVSRRRHEHLLLRDRSMLDDAELRGGLELQHQPLFFVDLRVLARDRRTCERIASELRSQGAENHLVERGAGLRHGLLGVYARRIRRGEGNPLPPFRKGVFAPDELAALWQLPSVDYLTVPLARSGLPRAPAPPAVLRPQHGGGMLRDVLGPVSIHVPMRRQNVAVPGTVEQGKSSFLVATVAEDLRRERCAVIVLDPKGDAADAALSAVPPERTCTLLDFSNPTCGFNPLAVEAPADVIADYVVAALKNLFSDADIRASSDRYLRNAIIAVLAYDRGSTLWDAARLLSVGEEGYAYRSRVGARVRALPELKEISEFFTAELSAQLADARSTTTAKLDAPVNKLARLLNSPSIKRVLLNDSLRVDFDQVIAGAQVLVVKGALGAMGAGNTAVLMQLLVGMLDAALARQQDRSAAHSRVPVALKVDEAPLVINRGFVETMALKRSAGLETVACWQTDAQWTEREVRDQLDALFAHRVYFATASAQDARAAAALAMAEFSDTVRPGVERLSSLGHPDVRLHLPSHHALVSWVTPHGRQAPFIAQTIPMRVDGERLAHHAARQRARGARRLQDLRQAHWEHPPPSPRPAPASTGGDGGAGARVPVRARAAATASDPARAEAGAGPGRPRGPAASYGELVLLDGAHSARWAPARGEPRAVQLDQLDLEMLELIARMRYVLSSQLHRRFNPGKAPTATQRRLKRFADAGLVARLQFHRRDGGGISMCYAITERGLRTLTERDAGHACATPVELSARGAVSEDALRRVRHHVHVTAWTLALATSLESGRCTPFGPDAAVLAAPARTLGETRVPLALRDLKLPGGRTPHEFLRSDADGRRAEVERFETLRPDAMLRVRAPAGAPALDVLIEREDRLAGLEVTRKLERYDHFLAGWALHTARYGRRAQAQPLVVFICRDRARARACARNADQLLGACRAYPGEYPQAWEYPGREAVLFVAERDVHERSLRACGLERLPPHVRAAGGDERAREATPVARELELVPRTDAGR